MKELHSRACDPSQPRSHRRPLTNPSLPQTLLPSSFRQQVENFLIKLPTRISDTSRRCGNHKARSFCCRVFSPSSHFSRNNAVLLVDTVRRCFARRSSVKLENNGFCRFSNVTQQIFELKARASSSGNHFSFCKFAVSDDKP